MALRIRELPLIVFVIFGLVIGIGLVAVLETFAFSPVVQAREELASKITERDTQQQELDAIKDVERRYSEFKIEKARREQLLLELQTKVPGEKGTDELLRGFNETAINAQIILKRLVARPEVSKEYHAEIPFEIEVDASYYNLLDFFKRLSVQTRIINASALTLKGADPSKGAGATVDGKFTLISYYTPTKEETEAVAPKK